MPKPIHAMPTGSIQRPATHTHCNREARLYDRVRALAGEHIRTTAKLDCSDKQAKQSLVICERRAAKANRQCESAEEQPKPMNTPRREAPWASTSMVRLRAYGGAVAHQAWRATSQHGSHDTRVVTATVAMTPKSVTAKMNGVMAVASHPVLRKSERSDLSLTKLCAHNGDVVWGPR